MGLASPLDYSMEASREPFDPLISRVDPLATGLDRSRLRRVRASYLLRRFLQVGRRAGHRQQPGGRAAVRLDGRAGRERVEGVLQGVREANVRNSLAKSPGCES